MVSKNSLRLENVMNEPTPVLDRTRHLCSTCISEFPKCPANFSDVEYGDGPGHDNVINCTKYEEDE